MWQITTWLTMSNGQSHKYTSFERIDCHSSPIKALSIPMYLKEHLTWRLCTAIWSACSKIFTTDDLQVCWLRTFYSLITHRVKSINRQVPVVVVVGTSPPLECKKWSAKYHPCSGSTGSIKPPRLLHVFPRSVTHSLVGWLALRCPFIKTLTSSSTLKW